MFFRLISKHSFNIARFTLHDTIFPLALFTCIVVGRTSRFSYTFILHLRTKWNLENSNISLEFISLLLALKSHSIALYSVVQLIDAKSLLHSIFPSSSRKAGLFLKVCFNSSIKRAVFLLPPIFL